MPNCQQRPGDGGRVVKPIVNEPGQKMRGCKRPSLMVPGEKWDFWGPHRASNKSSTFDFFDQQKNMRKELDECGITEGRGDRYLIRKAGKSGLCKGSSLRHLQMEGKPIRATGSCQIPKSKLEVSCSGLTHTTAALA